MEEIEDLPSSPSLGFLSAIVRCAFVEVATMCDMEMGMSWMWIC